MNQPCRCSGKAKFLQQFHWKYDATISCGGISTLLFTDINTGMSAAKAAGK